MKKKYYWIIGIIVVLIFSALTILLLYNQFKSICFGCGHPNPPSECETHGGKCYGFGDLVAENCEDHNMITLPYACPSITINTQCCSYGE